MMTQLTLELPAGLRAEVASEASRRGVSEAAWLEEAAREKLAANEQLRFMSERAACADHAAAREVLRNVPDVPPEPGDEL